MRPSDAQMGRLAPRTRCCRDYYSFRCDHAALSRQDSGELITQLEKVGRAVEQENWRKANRHEVRCWDYVSQKWALFTDHMELDNLEMKLARLRENLHTGINQCPGRFWEALML